MTSLCTAMTRMCLCVAHARLVLTPIEPSSGRTKIERRMTGVGQAARVVRDLVKVQVHPQGHICRQIRAEHHLHFLLNGIREGGALHPRGQQLRWQSSIMGMMEVLEGAQHFRSAPDGNTPALLDNLRKHHLAPARFLLNKPRQYPHHQINPVAAHSLDVIPQ